MKQMLFISKLGVIWRIYIGSYTRRVIVHMHCNISESHDNWNDKEVGLQYTFNLKIKSFYRDYFYSGEATANCIAVMNRI